uniref:Uncharacterized protein n=1 Tax=Oryzias sinensis TaxID=183150 RepID=A0A8C7WWI8_9TELE
MRATKKLASFKNCSVRPNKRLILLLSPGFMAVCLCCQMPLSAVFNLAITNSMFKQPSRYFFGHSSIFFLSLTDLLDNASQPLLELLLLRCDLND